jgi:hypothetical protein
LFAETQARHPTWFAGAGNNSYTDITITSILSGPYMFDNFPGAWQRARLQVSTIFSPVPIPYNLSITGGEDCIGVKTLHVSLLIVSIDTAVGFPVVLKIIV